MERKLVKVKRERRKDPTNWVTLHFEIPVWLAVVAVVLAAAFLAVSLGVFSGG